MTETKPLGPVRSILRRLFAKSRAVRRFVDFNPIEAELTWHTERARLDAALWAKYGRGGLIAEPPKPDPPDEPVRSPIDGSFRIRPEKADGTPGARDE